MENPLEDWCSKLRVYWITKDIDKILELFSTEVVYYETPEELILPQNLRDIWSEINDQQIIYLNYNVGEYKNNIGNVSFTLDLKDETIEMIYIIELNNENKCTRFMQTYEIFKRLED